jgi:hypothetical protein
LAMAEIALRDGFAECPSLLAGGTWTSSVTDMVLRGVTRGCGPDRDLELDPRVAMCTDCRAAETNRKFKSVRKRQRESFPTLYVSKYHNI